MHAKGKQLEVPAIFSDMHCGYMPKPVQAIQAAALPSYSAASCHGTEVLAYSSPIPEQLVPVKKYVSS